MYRGLQAHMSHAIVSRTAPGGPATRLRLHPGRRHPEREYLVTRYIPQKYVPKLPPSGGWVQLPLLMYLRSMSNIFCSHPPVRHYFSTRRNHMHEAVHWRALHRLDVQPDEWPVDVSKYNLVCSIGQFGLTGDGGAASRLAQEARNVDSRSECTNLQARVADWRYFV